MASSLVSTRISAALATHDPEPYYCSLIWLIIGIRKAPDSPVSFSARAMILLPSIISGIESYCTGAGSGIQGSLFRNQFRPLGNMFQRDNNSLLRLIGVLDAR